MTNQELVKIAEDIHAGRIFTDRHLRPGEYKNMLSCVFMPLLFMDDKGWEEFKKLNPALIYEYYDKAGRMGVNGYPIFFSMRFLNKEEAEKVFKALKEIEEAMEVVRKGVASDLEKK